jgi:signal peptidase
MWRALTWCVLLAVILLIAPRMYMPGELHMRGTVFSYGIVGAIVCLAFTFVVGVVLKCLAATPYDISLVGVAWNLFTTLPYLGARELTRAYLLGLVWRIPHRPRTATVLITVGLALLQVNYHKLILLNDVQSIVIFLAIDIAPIFAESALLTVFALYGGAAPAFAYAALLEIFMRVFPYLPSLPWLATSVIGVGFPILYAFFVQERCLVLSGKRVIGRTRRSNGYLVALALSVAFFWFCLGVFPVSPSVVLTGSMEPGIQPGDVVLIQKVRSESDIYALKETDVINFQREDYSVTHRILQVQYDKAGNISFVTKGDNNDAQDDVLVQPNDVNGIVTCVVPKVGIPVLVMNSGEKVPEGVVNEKES